MVKPIARIPISVKSAIDRIMRDPRHAHNDLRHRATNLSKVPQTVSMDRQKLAGQQPVWATAILGPCIFVAAAALNKDGAVTTANAGHFSTRINRSQVQNIIKGLDSPAKDTRVWISGMAQKSSEQSLRKTCENLVKWMNLDGLPLNLSWTAHDRPIITDTRTSRPVSDVGLGLISDERPESIVRDVAFGVSEARPFFISTSYARFMAPNDSILPLLTRVFTADQEALTKNHIF